METCCEYTDSVMWVSTDERRMITRMMKLIAEHPDETEIIKRPEENDGCLYCKVPATWLKIAPPVKREMSEKQRAAAERICKRHRHSGVCLKSPDAVLKNDPVRRSRGKVVLFHL